MIHKKAFLAVLCILAAAAMVLPAAGAREPEPEKIVVGVGGWAVEPTQRAVEELGFTEETGIEVEVVTRPGSPPEFLSQMSSAILGGTSPYDVIDIEDDVAIGFSRSGWLVDLDPLFDDEFWDDWPEAMLEMTETWSRHGGELFRVPHNYEAQYFWYRKDILDSYGLQPPQTWDEMVEVGKAVTSGDRYGVSDGLAQGAYLGVYITYLTQQAGGNVYDMGPEFEEALQFLYDMIHVHEVFPISALDKDYDQVNNDYMQDRVVMMRQWPFFYGVARSNPDWFAEDKAQVALPPAGPAEQVAYAGSWGWSVPTTADNMDGAMKFVEFMSRPEHQGPLAEIDTWFLSARDSCLEYMDGRGMAEYLELYSDAGVIGTRPFHPAGQEAHTVVEETAAAYLTNQMTLRQAVRQGRQRMADLD